MIRKVVPWIVTSAKYACRRLLPFRSEPSINPRYPNLYVIAKENANIENRLVLIDDRGRVRKVVVCPQPIRNLLKCGMVVNLGQ